VTLTNNWIYNNGRTGEVFGAGVWLNNNNASAPLVRNNTIYGNPTCGIEASKQQIDPNILNCIIYGNELYDLYRETGTFSTVNYSCLQGPFDPCSGTGNISSDPCFVDVDANNFHLNANSPCIDAGIPDFEPDANETDIDGSPRVIGDEVDMGADEFWRETDFSGDGVVNFVDYAMLTSYWRDSGIDYNEVTGLGDANSPSLGEFCDDWLLKAEWWTEPMPLMSGRGGGGMAKGLGFEAAAYQLAAVEEKPRITEPVDVKGLLDWLAEIWLDPDVREAIHPEDWLKLYESLKEME